MKWRFFVVLMVTTVPCFVLGQTSNTDYDSLIRDLKNDRLDQREQEEVSRRISETNDPELIRRLIQVTGENSEENGDNRIIKGLTYSRDPQVREFMINILRNNQAGIHDRFATLSSPEGYASRYLAELAEAGDSRIVDIFREVISSPFIQENSVVISTMSEAIAERGTQEDINFLFHYIQNPALENSRSVVDALASQSTQRTTDLLIELVSHREEEISERAARNLMRRLERDSLPESTQIRIINSLTASVGQGNLRQDQLIIESIIRTGQTERHLDLVNLFISQNTDSHEDLVRALAENSRNSYNLSLLEQIALNTTDPAISSRAAEALLPFNNPRHLEIMKNSLIYERNYNKEEIIAFIEQHGSPLDFLNIFDLLSDNQKSVRLAAFDAISRMMRETFTEDQFQQLIACLNQPQYERSETMLLIAALTDISLSYAARSESRIGINAYNNSRGVRNIEPISRDHIESLKDTFLMMLN